MGLSLGVLVCEMGLVDVVVLLCIGFQDSGSYALLLDILLCGIFGEHEIVYVDFSFGCLDDVLSLNSGPLGGVLLFSDLIRDVGDFDDYISGILTNCGCFTLF